MNLQSIKESLMVFGFFTGILLPLRILFVHFAGNNSFGTFGLLSGVSVLLIVLIKKNKLGRFGLIVKRRMLALTKGKKGILFYLQSIFFIFLTSLFIIMILMGKTTYHSQTDVLTTNHPELNNQTQIISGSQQVSWKEWLLSPVIVGIAIITQFPLMSSGMAIMDNTFHGLFLSLFTIVLIQQLEIFLVVFMYKLSFRNNQELN